MDLRPATAASIAFSPEKGFFHFPLLTKLWITLFSQHDNTMLIHTLFTVNHSVFLRHSAVF